MHNSPEKPKFKEIPSNTGQDGPPNKVMPLGTAVTGTEE